MWVLLLVLIDLLTQEINTGVWEDIYPDITGELKKQLPHSPGPWASLEKKPRVR